MCHHDNISTVCSFRVLHERSAHSGDDLHEGFAPARTPWAGHLRPLCGAPPCPIPAAEFLTLKHIPRFDDSGINDRFDTEGRYDRRSRFARSLQRRDHDSPNWALPLREVISRERRHAMTTLAQTVSGHSTVQNAFGVIDLSVTNQVNALLLHTASLRVPPENAPNHRYSHPARDRLTG